MKIKKLEQLDAFTSNSKWLIEDILLQQGLAVLVAAPKSTKSFFSLELCASLALGVDFLNYYKSAEACRVLYFGAEDTEAIIHERLSGILKGKGAKAADNLGILTSSDGLRLDTDEGFAKLVEQIKSFQPKLMVLDCLYAIHRVSENDSGSILPVLERLREIREKYKTAVLLVHHTAKDTDGKRVGSRLRGSSAIWGFFESILGLRKNENDDIFLDVEHRAATSFQNVPIELKSDGIEIRYRLKTATPLVISQSEKQSYVQDQVIQSIQYRIPVPIEELSHRTGLALPIIRNLLYSLLKEGKVVWTKQGYLRGGPQ